MYFIEINVEIDYFSCKFSIDIFGFTYISMKIHILAIFLCCQFRAKPQRSIGYNRVHHIHMRKYKVNNKPQK